MFPKDFLWYDEKRKGFLWYYIYDEQMTVPPDFLVVDFLGGLYAVTTDIDGEDNQFALSAIKSFIK